ncbi:uncharacterized protein CPUR_04721 [Claviceps purpurea 20.1]|uniref:Tat pathway signal sequence n=1 Tax=Claviceps purpurea (strain 20.1) TaxID=1111077 RepID=M1W1E6_CLAP2|nr:uncharacterized protein CPUR_04721 [Claviceps purpurea 20.1]
MLHWKKAQPRNFEPEVTDLEEDKSNERDVFLDKGSSPNMDTPKRPPRRPPVLLASIAFTLLNLALLFVSIILLFWTQNQRRALLRNESNSLLKAVDAYSPVYDQVHVPFVDLTINGSLLDRGESIYRQAPSAEVDTAWDLITNQLPHAISSQDVLRLGKDPKKTAKWPSEWGFGSDAYIAELDIVHTVHCLNANLMCNANGDIVTNVWVEGQLHPFPDFNVNKKCRNYGTFIDWQGKNQITDVKRFEKVRKPHDHVPWKMSQKFHDLFQTGLKGGSQEEIEYFANELLPSRPYAALRGEGRLASLRFGLEK